MFHRRWYAEQAEKNPGVSQLYERPSTSMSTLIQKLRTSARAVTRRVECYRALATARPASLANLRGGRPRNVLIVCYGNICRSAFVSSYFETFPVPGLLVRSAGIHPVAGRKSPERYVQMCQSFGIDLQEHRSVTLKSQDLDWADLIVLMDRHNWSDLTERAVPQDRLIWLGALDGGPVEIADPYLLDDSDAQRVVERLAVCSKRLAEMLAG